MDLRPATIEDAQRLFEWRNDPLTRAQSHSTDEVDFPSHLAWLEQTLSNRVRKLYVVELEGRPVGTLRTDLTDGITELSWTVAPESRGLGVGTRMVRTLVATLAGPLRAQVKKGNIASCKIAEAAGFVLDHESMGVLHFVMGCNTES